MTRIHKPGSEVKSADPPHVRGLFGLSAPYIWLYSTLSDFDQAYQYFTVQSEVGPRLRLAPDMDRVSPERELQLARILLTKLHEDHHYYQMLSSPIGLFEFKAHFQNIGDAHRLFRNTIATHQGMTTLPTPLYDWARTVKSQTAFLACKSWELWNVFCDLFWHDTSSTAEHAAELATLLIQRMVESQWESYSNLDPRQKVKISAPVSDIWSIPTQTISTFKIVESHAEIITSNVMASMPLSPEVRDVLSAEIFNSPYLPFVEKYINEQAGQTIETMSKLALLDLSLLTPVDPCYHETWTRQMSWHDLHPPCRLESLLRCVSKVAAPTNADFANDLSGTYLTYVEQLSQMCRWPSVQDLHTHGTTLQCLLTPDEPFLWRLPTKLVRLHAGLSHIRLEAPGYILLPGNAGAALGRLWATPGITQYAALILNDEIYWDDTGMSIEEKMAELYEFSWLECAHEVISRAHLSWTPHLCNLIVKMVNASSGIRAEDLLKDLLESCWGHSSYSAFVPSPVC